MFNDEYFDVITEKNSEAEVTKLDANSTTSSKTLNNSAVNSFVMSVISKA